VQRFCSLARRGSRFDRRTTGTDGGLMSKKWYDYFVTVERPKEGHPEDERAPGAPSSAAQTVAEIASGVGVQTTFTAPVANPTSFEEIYQAAEITVAAHGYTIFKIADMLQSEHIRGLPANVKKSSVLLALDAAGVKVEDVIKDAVLRDKALDTYERVQEKALQELEARKTQENRDIQAEIDRLVAEHQARMQKNNDEVAKEKERFYGWRLKKQQEELKIADAVSYFATENPISTSGTSAASSPAPKPPGS